MAVFDAHPMPFGDLPPDFRAFETSRFVLLPVPFDGTASWLSGSAQGPQALLEASCHIELYDIESDSEPYRAGIFTAAPTPPAASAAEAVDQAYAGVKAVLETGKTAVLLTGDHSVSAGAVRAYAERYPNLTVLQLDAHSDLRDTFEGDRFNHACAMARIREHAPNPVAVGIRSMDSSERTAMDRERTFFAHQILGTGTWIPEVIESLGEFVYVTIDMDVFDPAYVPAVGTPEPGGLDWPSVCRLLRAVGATRRVVGFDVAELCPCGHKPSEFLAAKLVYVMMAAMGTPGSRS